jgi:hypothetical protein
VLAQTSALIHRMKTPAIIFAILLSASANVFAADAKLEVNPGDSTAEILTRQIGQVVELRLVGGEKIGGTVATVGSQLVHLSQLSEASFFDAAVRLDHISAVVVRTKTR